MVRGQGRLRLALPWLGVALESAAAEGRSVARMPAAEWLVARAPRGRRWCVVARVAARRRIDAGS